MSETLTAPERHKLTDLEGIIERGVQTFVEVGAALAIIRDQRLYRETHSDFGDYCQDKWGWTRGRSNQLIQAAEVVAGLDTVVSTLPTSERQARELARLPVEQRAEVWEKAVDTAPKKNGTPRVTTAHLREVANGTKDFEAAVRRGMEMEGASPEIAKAVGVPLQAFKRARYILSLADDAALSPSNREVVDAARDAMNEAGTVPADVFESVEPLVAARWGEASERKSVNGRAVENRVNNFERAYGALVQACHAAGSLDIPLLSPDRATEMADELGAAIKHVSSFRKRLQEVAS